MKSLCQYRYDALDQLSSSTPTAQEPILRFHQQTYLATEVQGHRQRSIFQQGNQLLAVLERDERNNQRMLIACDQQRSVLHGVDDSGSTSRVYTAYGQSDEVHGPLACLGFNGEQPDPITGHYLLGNYRVYNPVLMRFHSPDNLSPFAAGGLNSYAYCKGDPINFSDPTGHSPTMWVGQVLTSLADFRRAEHAFLLARHGLDTAAIPATATPIATTSRRAAQNSSDLIGRAKYDRNYTTRLKERRIREEEWLAKNPDIAEEFKPTNFHGKTNRQVNDAFNKAKKDYGFENYPDANIPLLPDLKESKTHAFDVTQEQFIRGRRDYNYNNLHRENSQITKRVVIGPIGGSQIMNKNKSNRIKFIRKHS